MGTECKFQQRELYKKLDELVPDIDKLAVQDKIQYKSDTNEKLLILDVLYTSDKITSIALTHLKPAMDGSQQAPCIGIAIDKRNKLAETIFIDNGGVSYEEIFYDDGLANDALGQEVNKTLNNWLTNIKKDGYKPIDPDLASLRRST